MAFDITVLAENLKRYRSAKKLTQQQLAEKLLLTPQSVSKWECGQSIPELDKLCAAADILEVSVEDLLGGRPSVMPVLVGVDGGGTKTEFVMFREDGTLLKHLVLEGSNPNLRGVEHCLSILNTGLGQLLDGDTRLVALHVGCAGFLSGNYAAQVQAHLQKRYPNGKISCSSDVMNIIASGSHAQRCVAAICGTGSVVYANAHRKLHRYGGAGYLLDTRGSGFDMGRDVLRAVLSEQDGVGPVTAMTPLVTQRLGSSVWDAIAQIYRQGMAHIASFAPIAFQAYGQGDALAEQILRKHAGYLAELIQVAADRHDCGKAVVLSGSIFTSNGVFLEMLRDALQADMKIEVPTRPPVYGACVLAGELYGIDLQVFKENFDRQYPQMCK